MQLKTDMVESFSHRSIAEEPIDTVGLPFDDDFFRELIPVVIEHIPGARNGSLVSLGKNHGRSYELQESLTEDETGRDRSSWTDQYGNVFTTLTTKGNNFSKAEIWKSDTAPSGFIPYGLQEGDALLRVMRASRLMREAGVDAEWIVRVEEPKQLHYEGDFIEPEEYTHRLISGSLGRTALSGVKICDICREYNLL